MGPNACTIISAASAFFNTTVQGCSMCHEKNYCNAGVAVAASLLVPALAALLAAFKF